jgi:hypothetical protein
LVDLVAIRFLNGSTRLIDLGLLFFGSFGRLLVERISLSRSTAASAFGFETDRGSAPARPDGASGAAPGAA